MSARPDLDSADATQQIEKFQSYLRQLEHELWSRKVTDQAIKDYQQAFRDYEDLLSKHCPIDNRAHFIITIPVADRPQQLHNCLQSILTLCELYRYGGFDDGIYKKISVVVADDSTHPENISSNKALCQQYLAAGIRVEYFGLDEQIILLNSLSADQAKAITPAIGTLASNIDKTNFSHKGASIMRNIAYLHLRTLAEEYNNALIYFIDSDQEFCINITTDSKELNVYAINYFHHINEIFSSTDIEVLTGKVVGDPPVSPSVMAGKFLDDVIAFLQKISRTDPESACEFHTSPLKQDDASYHDMAELFGFISPSATHDYHCKLAGTHTNHECLLDFTSRLNNFFHGEHLTRNTQFAYTGRLSTAIPARTVYTGNYLFIPKRLDQHIAFADLQLRMAGPALGRLLKSAIGDRFASANLPMLHSRTITGTGQSEFRTNIELSPERIDLSGEFELQYFGDIMLFTIIELTKSSYPQQIIPADIITDTLVSIEQKIHRQYMDKHSHIIIQAQKLRTLINQRYFCNTTDNPSSARNQLEAFIDNIEYNFGDASATFQMINDDTIRQNWLAKLHHAISIHKNTTDAWKQLFQ